MTSALNELRLGTTGQPSAQAGGEQWSLANLMQKSDQQHEGSVPATAHTREVF